MRRSILVAFLLVFSSIIVESSAQQVVKKRIGAYIENGNVVVAEANTTLAVDITIETEYFVAGPYAKHAQRLFGTQASLIDRVKHRLVKCNVGVVEEPTYLASESVDPIVYGCTCDEPHNFSFPKLLPDRLSKESITTEQAAERAAEQVYALRTSRLELVTAELGDGVYGAGLESALREIDDLEREYIELFFGKRIVTTKQHRYFIPIKPAEFEAVEPVVVPEGVDPELLPAQPEPKMLPASYVVARFAENSGIVDNDDLSGEIILLTITPTEMQYPDSYVSVKGKDKGVEMVQFRYANNAEVKLSLGYEVIAKRELPIYEFGRTVTFAIPVK